MAFAPSYNGEFIVNQNKKKKNKNPRNAFSFFLDEQVEQLKLEGFTITSKKDAVPAACARWKKVPEEMKEKYREKEREWKLKKKNSNKDKLTGRRERMEDIVDPMQVMQENLKKQHEYLMHWFEPLPAITKKEFYIIDIQSMYNLPSEKGYLPCELACVKFSLKEGIIDTFHTFVNPGQVPRGYNGECKLWSDKTHKIPLNFKEFSAVNNEVTWNQLIKFTGGVRDSEYILFSKGCDMRKNKWCIDWMATRTGHKSKFILFNLEEFIAEIIHKKEGSKPAHAVIAQGMNSTLYDSGLDTRCEFHDEIENDSCSKLIVKRCCFYIGLEVSNRFGIKAVKGKHLPMDRAVSFQVHVPTGNSLLSTGDGRSIIPNNYSRSPRKRSENIYKRQEEQDDVITTYQSRDIRNTPSVKPFDDQFDYYDYDASDDYYTSGDSLVTSSYNMKSVATSLHDDVSNKQSTTNILKEDDFPSLGSDFPSLPQSNPPKKWGKPSESSRSYNQGISKRPNVSHPPGFGPGAANKAGSRWNGGNSWKSSIGRGRLLHNTLNKTNHDAPFN